jgi:hypothetical protein
MVTVAARRRHGVSGGNSLEVAVADWWQHGGQRDGYAATAAAFLRAHNTHSSLFPFCQEGDFLVRFELPP